ncbi:Uu.00g080390.m01.CDS01 [Anthostomella pinea]|uniref:Uu.00g080390.m01.CDS01 n=1 Tax=Anthostomella pinea TaxID=933095 RepID=A0AAI8VL24_9PEZI|nr:Uu.00g080390.m01.CDS01 [Anthostomella pinea]
MAAPAVVAWLAFGSGVGGTVVSAGAFGVALRAMRINLRSLEFNIRSRDIDDLRKQAEYLEDSITASLEALEKRFPDNKHTWPFTLKKAQLQRSLALKEQKLRKKAEARRRPGRKMNKCTLPYFSGPESYGHFTHHTVFAKYTSIRHV